MVLNGVNSADPSEISADPPDKMQMGSAEILGLADTTLLLEQL